MSEEEIEIPEFENIEEEAEFWDDFDTAKIWDQMEELEEVVFTKPERQVVSFRMDRELVDRIKAYAQSLDTPYTALIRMWAIKGFKREVEEGYAGSQSGEENKERAYQ
ncbi:hypothetical protein KGY58_03140 [Candidatus Bipolaricaulota bacterium]|nr:hypothetical protein [Candidatus Bipolaricaulota bacterium]